MPLLSVHSQPGDLPSCIPSRLASQESEVARNISNSGSNSSSRASSGSPCAGQPEHKQCTAGLSLSCDQVEVGAAHHGPIHPAHRSSPGGPDIHPQEVLVKVTVQQRSSCLTTCKPVKPQGSSQIVDQHQQQQQQQDDQSEPLAATQDFQQGGAHLSSSRCVLSGCCSQGHRNMLLSTTPQQYGADSSTEVHSVCRHVPLLDLSRAQLGTSAPVKAVLEPQPLNRQQAERDDELCLELSSGRMWRLHANAPVHDPRCYHYKAVSTKVGFRV